VLAALPGCNLSERIAGPDGLERSAEMAKAKDAKHAGPGAVYVLSNGSAGNAVLAFARDEDGRLGAAVSYPTGGLGTSGGLGNQGGVILSHDARWLFAVNAGSDNITAFRVTPHGLRRTAVVASGGIRPVSLAAHGDLLFVLNTGGDGNVAGFRIRPNGRLEPIANATRPLSGTAVQAAQVGVTPDGEHLVVTERASSMISVYAVGHDGSLSGPDSQASSGTTPFGFGFDRRGTLVVSEAFGGAAGASAVSSYHVAGDGMIGVVSASVPTTQTAACWIAISGDSRFAYTTNAGSGTVTGYRLDMDGMLTRLQTNGVTATTGTGPGDLAFGGEGRYLYVRNNASTSISAYLQHHDGSLEPIPGATGLPAGANGIAAR
jgi:6-phosphogluconolactonase (cycloisomerase 2 family)